MRNVPSGRKARATLAQDVAGLGLVVDDVEGGDEVVGLGFAQRGYVAGGEVHVRVAERGCFRPCRRDAASEKS
jgi:hypothetical protein